MKTFADRLKEEMDYVGISRKELAYYADVKQRALDMYLGTQQSMPAADIAVKLAKVLHVSVEYLVTGKNSEIPSRQNRMADLERDLESLPTPIIESVSTMIHALAENEKKHTADA